MSEDFELHSYITIIPPTPTTRKSLCVFLMKGVGAGAGAGGRSLGTLELQLVLSDRKRVPHSKHRGRLVVSTSDNSMYILGCKQNIIITTIIKSICKNKA